MTTQTTTPPPFEETGTGRSTTPERKTSIPAGISTYRIALYYWYIPLAPSTLDTHRNFHEDTCHKLNLKGRIRVSSEGLNGVLSGELEDLKLYEEQLREEVASLQKCVRIPKEEHISSEQQALPVPLGHSDSFNLTDMKEEICHGMEKARYGESLDVKYCHLRPDVPLQKQLFDKLVVKVTREIISLNESSGKDIEMSQKKGRRRGRGRRRKKGTQYPKENIDVGTDNKSLTRNTNLDPASSMKNYTPATHLTPEEWNDHLHNDDDAILLDARNCYESKVGHFASSSVPTILTNTRKYSSLPSTLQAALPHLAGKKVYMYCTGGVRCERASMYLQALIGKDGGAEVINNDDNQNVHGCWPEGLERPKGIYQLEGGIQKYLEIYRDKSQEISTEGESSNDVNGLVPLPKMSKDEGTQEECLFKGKNFVFDPRRYDPTTIGTKDSNIVGKCVICKAPHDDYDNGHAPIDNREARCCRCRVLVLVCNSCRSRVRVWGQDKEGASTSLSELFCGPGGKSCIDEGNRVEHFEIINGNCNR